MKQRFGPAITTVDWTFLPWGLGEGVHMLPLTIARIDVGGNQERSWLVTVGGDLLPGSPGVAVAWDC